MYNTYFEQNSRTDLQFRAHYLAVLKLLSYGAIQKWRLRGRGRGG